MKDAKMIGEGGGRRVYEHPFSGTHLIKVYKKAHSAELNCSLRGEKRRYGQYREWFIEYEEYIALLNRTNVIPGFIAGFYGFCQTDFGLGQIVEKVTDEDTGAISKSINLAEREHESQELIDAIDAFFQKVQETGVVFRDLHFGNLLVKKDSAGRIARIVAIDGLGDFTLYKIRRHSSFAHKMWLKKVRKATIQRILDNKG